ncbi:MAG: hypothetical protein ACYCT7_09880 [bacterium]
MSNFKFTGSIDKKIALPYVAKLSFVNNSLHREFILNDKNRTANGDEIIITGNFNAQDGDILEIKKSDMDVKWCLVENSQLHEVVDVYFTKTKDYASSRMLDVFNYLDGMLSARDLVYGHYIKKTKITNNNTNNLFMEEKND